MKTTNKSLSMYINLFKIFTENNRRFTAGLDGLGLTEFIILYHLSNAEDKKMRRIDLAETIGLTASGVTRILSPMEKIGLISKETAARDARVSFVKITSNGERNLEESYDRAQNLAEKIFPLKKLDKLKGLSDLLDELTELNI